MSAEEPIGQGRQAAHRMDSALIGWNVRLKSCEHLGLRMVTPRYA